MVRAIFDSIENYIFRFVVRRSQKLASIFHGESEKEIIEHIQELMKKDKAIGVEWSSDRIDEYLEKGREFRRVNVMMAMGIMVSLLSIAVSLLAVVIAVISFFK